jgi:hypothetical protein
METRRTTIFASGLFVLACSGKALDVGSNQNPGTVAGNGGTGGTGRAGGTAGTAGPGPGANAVLPKWPDPGSCAAGGDLPMAGVWEGAATADPPFNVPPHLERFRVTIGGTTETGACGSVVYGEGVPPPPASDADSRYPSAETGFLENETGFGGTTGSWGPMPGVSYTMLDTATDEMRVRFTVSLSELWNGWCALQTPVSTSIGYRCLPSVGGGTNPDGGCYLSLPGGQNEPVDCLKWALCSRAGACSCNAQECVASQRESYTYVEADLHFAGNDAWGTNGYHSVALRRIE